MEKKGPLSRTEPTSENNKWESEDPQQHLNVRWGSDRYGFQKGCEPLRSHFCLLLLRVFAASIRCENPWLLFLFLFVVYDFRHKGGGRNNPNRLCNKFCWNQYFPNGKTLRNFAKIQNQHSTMCSQFNSWQMILRNWTNLQCIWAMLTNM